MIESFRHKGLKRLSENGSRRLIRPDLMERCEDILAALDAATEVGEVDRQSFRLRALKQNPAVSWAVTVRANWRITYWFENGAALDVDLTDYH